MSAGGHQGGLIWGLQTSAAEGEVTGTSRAEGQPITPRMRVGRPGGSEGSIVRCGASNMPVTGRQGGRYDGDPATHLATRRSANAAARRGG